MKKSTKTMHLIVMPLFQIEITLPTFEEVRLQMYKQSFVIVLLSLLQFVV